MGRAWGPNVLLVVLDSVRAANCSLYGAPRETTPFLEAFAAEATTYTQARAPSNWSLPSHVSLFTGLETHEHRVTVDDALAPGHTVFEELAGDGYETAVVTENGFVASERFGVADCLGTALGVPEAYPDRYDTAALDPGPDGFYYADRFAAWRRDVEGPWAACLNLMDAHRPYEPRDAYDRWGDDRAHDLQAALDTRWEWVFHGGARPYWQLGGLEALYDGGIRQADAVTEQVVTALREDGVLDDTLVVVCGDHGEGFGTPGRLPGEPPAAAHIVPMHETLLHVPLLVRPPGGASGDRVHDPAALTRFPSVARGHVAGTPPERGFAVESVVASKQPVTGDLRDRFARHCGDVAPYAAPSRAVYANADGTAVRKRYYWGDDAGTTLVHRPGVVEPVDAASPARVDAAFDEPTVSVRDPRDDDGGVSDETKAHLDALGYY